MFVVAVHPKRLDESRQIAAQLTRVAIEDFQKDYGYSPIGMLVNTKAAPGVWDYLRSVNWTGNFKAAGYVLVQEHWLRIRPEGYRVFKVGATLLTEDTRTALYRVLLGSNLPEDAQPSVKISTKYKYVLNPYHKSDLITQSDVEIRGRVVHVAFDADVYPDEIWLAKGEA